MQKPHPTDRATIAEVLDALVAREGTGAHSYILSGKLLADRHAKRNLADAAHYLCVLHGRHPGVIDRATIRCSQKGAQDWLKEAAEGFARERSYVTRLAVAVGPIPSTLGHNQCETAVSAQRHALDIIAQSDRTGCAIGAAMALCLDWLTIRAIMDSAAERIEIKPPLCTLPDVRKTAELAHMLADNGATERAIHFGAQQILAQHRGLWDILSAREEARRET